MNLEDLLKFIANVGYPLAFFSWAAYWLAYTVWPSFTQWMQKFLNILDQKYGQLEKQDLSLNSGLQESTKQINQILAELRLIRREIEALKTQQEWNKRKIIEILNGLGYTNKWDDPKRQVNQNLDE